jgi:hypothetical protein
LAPRAGFELRFTGRKLSREPCQFEFLLFKSQCAGDLVDRGFFGNGITFARLAGISVMIHSTAKRRSPVVKATIGASGWIFAHPLLVFGNSVTLFFIRTRLYLWTRWPIRDSFHSALWLTLNVFKVTATDRESKEKDLDYTIAGPPRSPAGARMGYSLAIRYPTASVACVRIGSDLSKFAN